MRSSMWIRRKLVKGFVVLFYYINGHGNTNEIRTDFDEYSALEQQHQQQPKQVYDFSFANTTPVYTAADGRVHVFCAPMQPLPRNSISLFANVRVHWVFPHFLCTIVMTCFPWKLDIRLARVGLHFFFSLCLYYVLLFRFVRSFFLLIYNVQQSAPGIFSRSSEFHAVTVNSALLSCTFSMPYCRTTVCKNRWM